MARRCGWLGLALCLVSCFPAAPAPAASPHPETPTAVVPVTQTVIAPATSVPTVTRPPVTLTSTPSPTTTPLPPTATSVPDTVLIFTGDINPGRCVYAYAKAADDMALPYRGIAEVLQAADIAVGSLDGTLSDYNPAPPCAENHRNLMAPTEAVQGMAYAGFDVITVATNHAKDCGLIRGCTNQSFLDTLATLRTAGIQPTGGGLTAAEALAPVILTVHGTRFAFIGLSAVNNTIWATDTQPGTAPFDTEQFTAAVARAKAAADVVIVLPQWGREFTPRLSWLQYKGARALDEAGATLIVGNNPHRVQGLETLEHGAVVAYALGNFVFDQEWTDGTQYTVQGVLLRATFHGAELKGVELLPIHIYDNFQPRLAEPAEAAQILQAVQDSLTLGPGN